MGFVFYNYFSLQVYIILVVIGVVLVWYLRFLWKNRDMLMKSWNHPGPINLPLIGAAYMVMSRPENILTRIVKLQEKYPDGLKLWFGTKLVYSLHHPEQIEKVLGSSKMVEKDDLYQKIVDVIGEGLIQASVKTWKKHRKCIGPSFGQRALDSFVEVFARKSKILTKILENHVGTKDINVMELLSRCTLDILCETALGLQLEIQGQNADHANNFDKLMTLTFMNIFQIWNHVGFIWRVLGHEKRTRKCVNKLNELSDKVIQEKMKLFETSRPFHGKLLDQQQTQSPDVSPRLAFLDYIMQNGEFNVLELRDEVNTFLIAGTDTTASALSFLFAILGMFPDIQQKVYEEVIEVIGEEGDPEPGHLPSLVYTERVIKETLRLFPVGGLFLRSINQDIDMGNYIVPKGASVMFVLIGIHRNPKYWPDPLKFEPDRFLPEENAKRHPCCYIPFSFGPRNCIGKVYGMMNMKVIIATVIRKFRIHCEYKRIEDIQLKSSFVLRFRDGAKVSVSLRKSRGNNVKHKL